MLLYTNYVILNYDIQINVMLCHEKKLCYDIQIMLCSDIQIMLCYFNDIQIVIYFEN